jgi:hypothetical protein
MMSANGISGLTYKRDRQVAKLNLAADNRDASGRRRFFDLDQLPSVYAEADNDARNRVDNANTGGLIVGRPWSTTSGVITGNLVMSLDAAVAFSGATWSDISGNANNATLVNGPTYTATDGGAVVLDGNNDYIRSPDLYTAIGNPDTFSAGAWVRPTASGVVLQVTNTPTPETAYHFTAIEFIESAGNPVPHFGLWAGAAITSDSGTALSYNTWYHMMLTYNGSVLKGYINGAEVASASVTYNSPHDDALTNHYLLWGAGDSVTNMGDGSYLTGSVGEIRVYTNALTPAQVLNNYNETKSRFDA